MTEREQIGPDALFEIDRVIDGSEGRAAQRWWDTAFAWILAGT